MAITKVAVAGGSGNLGPAVVKALLDSNFEVTILSRSTSHESDLRAKIQSVDYTSSDSLITALKGQDALINVLAYGPIPEEIHFRLVEAAYKAGVQRFIPSEFGGNTTNPLTAKLPVFAGKIAIAKRLQEIAEKDDNFTWTVVVNGPFFDWGLKQNFIINLAGPSTEIYNGGDDVFSTTTLGGIGRAVSGILGNPAETKNRYVFVAEAEVSQNQILGWSGKADQITVQHVRSEDLEKEAFEAVQRSPPDHRTFAVNLIRRAIFTREYGSLFERLDNELLGVKKLSESEVIELVKQNS